MCVRTNLLLDSDEITRRPFSESIAPSEPEYVPEFDKDKEPDEGGDEDEDDDDFEFDDDDDEDEDEDEDEDDE